MSLPVSFPDVSFESFSWTQSSEEIIFLLCDLPSLDEETADFVESETMTCEAEDWVAEEASSIPEVTATLLALPSVTIRELLLLLLMALVEVFLTVLVIVEDDTFLSCFCSIAALEELLLTFLTLDWDSLAPRTVSTPMADEGGWGVNKSTKTLNVKNV